MAVVAVVLEVGLHCAALHSGGTRGRHYPVVILAISSQKSHKEAPYKVHFTGFGVHQWKHVSELMLPVPKPKKAKAKAKAKAKSEAKPELRRQETYFDDLHYTYATSEYKKLGDEMPARTTMFTDEQFERGLLVMLELLARQPGAEADYERVTQSFLASIESTRDFLNEKGVAVKITQSERTKFMSKMLWTAPILEGQEEIFEGYMDLADVRDLKFNGEVKEFCWVLNMVIRLNEKELLEAAMPIIQALNKHVVAERRPRQPRVDWGDHALYRGGGFHMAFKDFFAPGFSFRTVGFVSCTPQRGDTVAYLQKVNQEGPEEPVNWTYHVHQERKCHHINFIDASQVVDADCAVLEEEFLFAPFSAFKVREVRWRERATWEEPHEIELDVYPDNAALPEDLPLAPWQ